MRSIVFASVPNFLTLADKEKRWVWTANVPLQKDSSGYDGICIYDKITQKKHDEDTEGSKGQAMQRL